MEGKQAVINIGQRIIQIIRQKLMFKYGSTVCVQKHARKISQWQDLKRSGQARINVHCYRKYMSQNQGKMTLNEHIKILNEIQAGNCGQMSLLTYEILCAIVPPGLKVESRSIKNPKDNESHEFVTIRPLGTKDNEQILVIDPWPSNQLINPEVVSIKDYFLGEKQNEIFFEYSNESVKLNQKAITNFDHIQIKDFNLSKLQEICKQIEKKEFLINTKWNFQRYVISKQPTIHYLVKLKEQWELFKHRRLDIKSVRKQPAIALS